MFNFIEWSYKTYLERKSVVVVGGSPGAVAPKSSQAEVVVRINSHLKNQGGWCDVLYHTGPPIINSDLVSEFLTSPEFVFLNLVDGGFENRERPWPLYVDFLSELRVNHPTTEVGFFAQGTWGGNNPYGPQYEWLNALHKKYSTKLFTGLVALAHILKFSPSRVEVRGMNMYLDKTGGELVRKVESHELKGNLQFLADCRSDSRVHYDSELTEALSRYGF